MALFAVVAVSALWAFFGGLTHENTLQLFGPNKWCSQQDGEVTALRSLCKQHLMARKSSKEVMTLCLSQPQSGYLLSLFWRLEKPQRTDNQFA